MDLTAPFTGPANLLVGSGLANAEALALGVLMTGVCALIAVHGPLARQLRRLTGLCRELEGLAGTRPDGSSEARTRRFDELMSTSPLQAAWTEFSRRRDRFDLSEPDEAAPVRFQACLRDHPLAATRLRSGLARALPLLLLGIGTATSIAALAGGLTVARPSTGIANLVGLALWGAFWGVVLASVAALLATLLRDRTRELLERVGDAVEQTYAVVTAEEITLLTADAQLRSHERNAELLRRLQRTLRESLEIVIDRIETAATASDANSDQQQRALEHVTRDLASAFHYRLEDQLSTLQESMQQQDEAETETETEQGADPSTSSEMDAAETESREDEAGTQVASILTAAPEPDALDPIDEPDDPSPSEPASAQEPNTTDGAHAAQTHRESPESVLRKRASKGGDRPDAPASEDSQSEDGKSGYSALLHRYEAPRFSLDELSPELRSFDTEAAIERARNAGIAGGGSLRDSLEDTGAAATLPPAPGDFEPEAAGAPDASETPLSSDGDRPEEDRDERRLRLAQFLRRR